MRTRWGIKGDDDSAKTAHSQNKLWVYVHQMEISPIPFGYKHDARHVSYAGRSIMAIRNIASADRTGQPLGGLPKGEHT